MYLARNLRFVFVIFYFKHLNIICQQFKCSLSQYQDKIKARVFYQGTN